MAASEIPRNKYEAGGRLRGAQFMKPNPGGDKNWD